MDWFTIVLIIIFFVLPVIQQVLEQARRKNAPPPGEWDGTDAEVGAGGSVEIPPRRVGTPQPKSGENGWSEDWVPWPTESQPSTEVGKPAEQTAWFPAPPSEVIRAKPDPVPVEARRVEGRVDHAPPPPKRTASARRAALSRPVARQVPTRPAGEPIGRLLRSRKDLRTAVILREVLGPPLSLGSPGNREHVD